MHRQIITKKQAIQMMESYFPAPGHAAVFRDAHRTCSPRGEGVFHGPAGTKIGIIRVGAVWRWYVSGYAQDGSDVKEALSILADK